MNKSPFEFIFASDTKGIFYLQIISTLIFLYAIILINVEWYWWLASVFVYFLTGALGITITFHRYLAHKSFKMPRLLEYIFSFLGAMGGTGSSIGWLAVHKSHHRYSDTDKDPHNPHKIGLKLLLSSYEYTFNFWDAKSLLNDKFHLILHRYYYLIMMTWALVLFTIDIKFLIFLFFIPVFFQIWASNISNYANHMFGYQNYKTSDTSKNTWWVSAITWGEGWHNNHHAEPWTYTFQRRWWEIDVSAYTIYLITLLTGNKKSLYTSKY